MCKQEIGSACRRKNNFCSVAATIAVATVFVIGAYRVYRFFFKGRKCCKKIASSVDDTE